MLTQQAKRLLELVENLLDLSRLEADSIRIAPTRIDVAERLEAIVDAALAATASRSTLRAGLAADRRRRRVRPDRLEPARERAPPRGAADRRLGDERRTTS